MNRHLLSIGVGSADPTVDRAGRRLRHAIDDGGIEPVDRMRLELLRQSFMRAVGLCDDQQARSILVDAMNDAGARHAADSGESALAMMEQRLRSEEHTSELQ